VVRKAIEAMQKQGAETVEVTVAGLEEQLRGSSVIDAEFKFDLMDYLARTPAAPVHSLAEILERGEYHASLEGSFTRRNGIVARETDAYRRARIKREAVRAIVAAAMDEQKLDVLAYPVLRRKAAIIGEPQRGGENCQLSPSTGFPAISIPAGFTADGLPIGVELLGGVWTEPKLLAIAYAYEQATRPRLPPPTTPELVNGKAPVPTTFTVALGDKVTALLTFDPISGRLAYEIAPAQEVGHAAVHRGVEGQNGPVIDATLSLADRDALEKGALYLAVRMKAQPDRVLRAQLKVTK
jgi:amidase